MITSILRIGCLSAAACLVPTLAQAQNGLFAEPRIFNDYPASTLTITNSNSNPGNVTIRDENMVNATGNGANRHDVTLSTDGGASPASFPITQGFTISTSVTLTNGSNTPRKEAGIRINSPVTGDALFIINSDAGEIVAFGGPFYNFRGAPFNEAAYAPGQTILMGMTYTPGAPGTLEYFIDRGSGLRSSGPLAFSNLEGGPVNYEVSVYAQGGSNNNANDFVNVNFANINAVVPEPASLGLASLAAMGLLARRRK